MIVAEIEPGKIIRLHVLYMCTYGIDDFQNYCLLNAERGAIFQS